MKESINAEVISVFPNKVRIAVDKLEDFKIADEKLKVGSYLRIADNENAVLIAVIENFTIEVSEKGDRKYILEANPLGIIRNGEFERGGDTIAIPPKKVEPAKKEEIKQIFEESLKDDKKFVFSKLSTDRDIPVPVDGDRFFNKHIAVVGSTGSGKSHSVAKIIQEAVLSKKSSYMGLNNSHVIIFDIHAEYKAAFPDARIIDTSNLVLPYWLLNSDELQELFLDTDANDHNQRNIFKETIISSRKKHFDGDSFLKEKIHFDSPLFFELNDILSAAEDKNVEMVPGASNKLKAGPLNGKLSNYVSRLENKINDSRLDFLLGERSKEISFENTIEQLIGYGEDTSNVTILDLSGVPFEVLSITVSLVSRIMFEYGYYYKRLRHENNPGTDCNNDVPLLLVYEEAHKYVPNSDLVKYRASKQSIERIAKEGRKYGVSLLLASQRPSEISETIFSQCSNFLALRLTNPNDQNYVKRLLPDTLGDLVEKMPSLRAGECLLIGDAVVLPSIVQVDKCSPEPASNDIPYFQLWKEEWVSLSMEEIKKIWYKN
ncbi:hypothetical protein EP58_08035 [Listeria newyorkensis]|nr:hypothetical protein EP58_08035 [Listeria newyorkensis]